MRTPSLFASVTLFALATTLVAQAGPPSRTERERSSAPADAAILPAAWTEALDWRCIGPANMGGRIIALAVSSQDATTWWAATASGGLLKTQNNGITFEHQFDHESTVSIGDVAVAPSDQDIVWVGTGEANPRNSVSWGDGVYKSIDGGKTWKNMGLKKSFQIGRIVIHPENPDIVYVGALGRLWGPGGERGLYKTTDGGKTWERVLFVDDETGVIDVAMHPADPETLLVATWERRRDGFDTNAPAKRWGAGSGLHRTTDGGKTWKRVAEGLPSCQLGRIGLDWYLGDPDVVFALVASDKIGGEPENAPWLGASWENAEAGARLTRVVEDGPAAQAGLKAGDIVLAVGEDIVRSGDDLDRFMRQHAAGDTSRIEASRDRQPVVAEVRYGSVPEDQRRPPFGTRLGGQVPDRQDRQGKDGHEYGGLYRSDDAGETWKRINSINPRPMYFSQVRVDPSDQDVIYVLGISLHRSEDGGKTFQRDAGRGVHADQHAMWIDPSNGRHVILGNDGGIYVTYDACEHWDHLNHVAIGQFYHVACDTRRNYRVYGGLQDNGSWGGPSRAEGGPVNSDWVRIGGGDGFICRVDPDDPDLVYYESQNGAIGRRNLRTGERGSLRPRGTREERERYRFNWETPFILSHTNPRIYYVAGSRVFRSLDRGEGLKPISPEITRTDRGSASALAESPLDPEILYAGTDDGALWVTRDGGRTWEDVWLDGASPAARAPEKEGADETAEVTAAEKPASEPASGAAADVQPAAAHDAASPGGAQETVAVPEVAAAVDAAAGRPAGAREREGRRSGRRRRADTRAGRRLSEVMPGPRWVSEIVASSAEAGRAYVTFDGHRSDDDAPHVLVTEDAGRTWRDLTENLPEGCGAARTVAEDPLDPETLWLGTEFGCWVSLDRGSHWTRLAGAFPTVAVHAFAIHPTAGEVVVATHGRSLWILDAAPLRRITAETIAAEAALYPPHPAVMWHGLPGRGGTNRAFEGENPPSGARIYYSLAKETDDVSLTIEDHRGRTVRTLEAPSKPGLHRVVWDLRKESPGSRGSRWRRGGRLVEPGLYVVRLEAGGKVMAEDLRVEADPDHPDTTWTESEGLDEPGEEEEDSGASGPVRWSGD